MTAPRQKEPAELAELDERAFALDVEDGQADGYLDRWPNHDVPENQPSTDTADEFTTGDPDDSYSDWWL